MTRYFDMLFDNFFYKHIQDDLFEVTYVNEKGGVAWQGIVMEEDLR